MKFSENDNIYYFNAISVLDKYAQHIDGTPDCMVGICYTGALDTQARQAILATCEKLNLGECAWIDVVALEPTDIFELLEGLDPRVLIVTDSASAAKLGEAYRWAPSPNSFYRVFGRSCVVFSDFQSMLADSAAKQRGWALLKKLQ